MTVSLKVSAAIHLAKTALANGNAVVIGLQGTGEAAMQSDEDSEEIFSAPKSMIKKMIKKLLPLPKNPSKKRQNDYDDDDDCNNTRKSRSIVKNGKILRKSAAPVKYRDHFSDDDDDDDFYPDEQNRLSKTAAKMIAADSDDDAYDEDGDDQHNYDDDDTNLKTPFSSIGGKGAIFGKGASDIIDKNILVAEYKKQETQRGALFQRIDDLKLPGTTMIHLLSYIILTITYR